MDNGYLAPDIKMIILEKRIQLLETQVFQDKKENIINEELDENYVNVDVDNIIETSEQELVKKEIKKEPRSERSIRIDQPITVDLLEKIFGTWIKRKTNLVSEYIYWIYMSEYNSRGCDKIDWSIVSKDQNLNHAIMEEFVNKLDWPVFSQYGWIFRKTKEMFADKIIWSIVCQRAMADGELEKFLLLVSDNDMKKYIDAKDKHAWNYLKKCPNLSKEFLRKNKESFLYYQTAIGSKNGDTIFDELLDKLPSENPLGNDLVSSI